MKSRRDRNSAAPPQRISTPALAAQSHPALDRSMAGLGSESKMGWSPEVADLANSRLAGLLVPVSPRHMHFLAQL